MLQFETKRAINSNNPANKILLHDPECCKLIFWNSFHLELPEKLLLLTLNLPKYLQQIVTNQFSRVAQNGRCSFIGNVSLGASVSLAELRELYDAVRPHNEEVAFDSLTFFTCLVQYVLSTGFEVNISFYRWCFLMVLKVIKL